MQLTHTLAPASPIKNQYKVEIKTYYGDADGYSNCTISARPDQIKQIIAEMLMVDNQFQNGRGGCRMMYDQTNYFGMGEEAYAANGNQHDGYWQWFDREWGDFPYNGDYEQNDSIDSYKISWYDENGVRSKVEVSDYADLLADLKALNDKHQVGSYDLWEDPRYPYHLSDKEGMKKYHAERAAISARFAAYRADAIEIVKKHAQ